jgi:tartrate dehydrogenase/decarboxylase/D-malate dehydrogenase
MIWSAAMMLDFLGRGTGAGRAAHDAIVAAIRQVLVSGPHTADLGGSASTTDMGKAIAAAISAG